ncbi:MAG: SCP2 sterol-binding domain-containing protein [Actinomycetota bacterium]|nr:SCP2 sterol-binding domain-containing protein [Actinomycetota bacterium]
MSIRFLSDDWASAVMDAANADEGFTKAAGVASARIQQIITKDGAEPTRYWTIVTDGKIQLGVGDVEGPDATITQSYETAVALARREANPVTAFMMGKIKVDGNMGLLMGLAGALGKLADVMSTLDVEY